MARSYADAIACLNSLQTNYKIVEAIRKSKRKLNEQAIPEMLDFLKKIGYQPSDIDRLNVIHIAGTKGKGSTAAFTSSILNQFISAPASTTGRKTSKVGLYTSPHLRFVRERIQINGQPLSEEKFTQYFFDIWDKLKDESFKPVYFRFLTLMAYHAYIREGVDVAIIECGVGGAYDSTNMVTRPLATAITNLGIDHVAMLGDTIEEIAWHKAGVMKKGARCFTPSTQNPAARVVLERVAEEKGVELVYVDVDPSIQNGTVQLGLEADFQKINASIAVAICKECLTSRGYPIDQHTQSLISKGLQRVRWPGRCETRHEKGITWCIDGGHTLDSLEVAGRWFASHISTGLRPNTSSTTTTTTLMTSSSSQTTTPTSPRFLIFNQQGSDRNADALARALYTALVSGLKTPHPFTHAVFCTNMTFKEGGYKPDFVSINSNAPDVDAMRVQKQLAETWRGIDPECEVHVVRTIEEAVGMVRGVAEQVPSSGDLVAEKEEVTVLVTGSLHLVGGFIDVLESEQNQTWNQT